MSNENEIINQNIENDPMNQNSENNSVNQSNGTDFTTFFEDTVKAFLDPNLINQRENIEKQLNEWKSNLTYVPLLIECIQTTNFSSPLFFASLCIKFLLERYKDDIELHIAQDIFTGVAYRLRHLYGKNDANNKDVIANFFTPRVNLIKCISLVQVYFPEFIEEWHNFTPDDSKILFCFLFEEEQRQIPGIINTFVTNIANITEDNIKKVLKESEMSKEWLDLFKYALDKAPKIKVYSEFIPRLTVIPNDPRLYPSFINVFLECISNDYFYLSKKSADFLERICDICLDLIKVLITPPLDQISIQMASFLWKEIIDYDPEFLADHYSTFGLKALNFLSESLRNIAFIDEEFFLLVGYVGETFNFLIKNNPQIFCAPIFNFLKILLESVNSNPDKYMANQLTIPFNEVSKNSEVPQIQNFYIEILNPHLVDDSPVISPGAIFAVSSSTDAIKQKYSMKIAENILDNIDKLPTKIILNFIGECCNFYGNFINGLTDFAFNSLNSLNGEESSKAIVQLCKHHPQLIVDFIDDRFSRICEVAVDTSIGNINAIVNCVESLLFIMDFVTAESPLIKPSVEAINRGILDKVSHFCDNEDSCSCTLQLIIQFSMTVNQILNDFRNISMMTEFLTSLYSKIIDTINFTNLFYEFGLSDVIYENDVEIKKNKMKFCSFLQERLCEFVSLSLDANLIANKHYIMDWLGDALLKCPVTEHIKILEKLFELFPTENTLNFIMNAGSLNDNDLMLASLGFVKNLVLKNWNPFFSTFTQDYIFGPLNSLDPRIIDIALEIISALIDFELEAKTIFFPNEHYDVMAKVTGGIFTNFQDIEIRKSINIWIKLFEGGFVHPNTVIEYILTKIPSKSAELHSLRTSICPSNNEDTEFYFDRMEILKAINSLKATLSQ